MSRIDSRPVTIDLSTSPVHRRATGSPFTDWAPAELETYRVGDRVGHETWGLGRVIELAEDLSLLVTFGGARTLHRAVVMATVQHGPALTLE